MTTFQLESVATWASEAKDLVYAHWQELGLDLDLSIDPDIEKMQAMENIGMFKVITAREDGKMVGYLLAIFSRHLHYKSSPPMFIVDAYYVSPESRSGTGAKLIRCAEGISRRLGAIKVYLSCKIHRDHSRLFVALGYKLSDFAFIKRI
jgi:hypothetical protein